VRAQFKAHHAAPCHATRAESHCDCGAGRHTCLLPPSLGPCLPAFRPEWRKQQLLLCWLYSLARKACDCELVRRLRLRAMPMRVACKCHHHWLISFFFFFEKKNLPFSFEDLLIYSCTRLRFLLPAFFSFSTNIHLFPFLLFF
jgi:hypothetical protein